MVESCDDVAERLYLQKDASGDISVPCSDLAQHQIDGVRFLFSQYKKEKKGVILNYPPGCGNCVQATVFISAICNNLKRPILILYDSDQEKEDWLARFAKWTTIKEDSIVVDTPNARLKKQIFIEKTDNIGKFYSQLWSIVVVKSDNFESIFRKCQLKVDFKIWITAQDLKKDTELLRSIYIWINPSDQLLQDYFGRKSPQLFKEYTTNEMLLDLLLEDTLFTRRDIKPFRVHKRKQDPEIQPTVKVSKKNKDATGTKIKRSKKHQEVQSTSTIQIENITSLHDTDNSFRSRAFPKDSNGDNVTTDSFTINADIDNDDEESKMDVESFIRDNDPLQSDMNLSYAMSNPDSTSQPSETSSPKAEEECTESSLNFTSAVADIIQIENNISTEVCVGSLNFHVDVTEDSNIYDLTQDATVDEEDVGIKKATGSTQVDLSKPAVHKVFYSSAQEGSSSEPKLGDQDKCEVKTEQKSSKGERNGVADQKRKLEVSSSVKKETDRSFDSKMKEMEERALKKFKGSVLDNILF